MILENTRIAVAKYGGPIALIKILENIYVGKDIIKEDICIFSNMGTIFNRIFF